MLAVFRMIGDSEDFSPPDVTIPSSQLGPGAVVRRGSHSLPELSGASARMQHVDLRGPVEMLSDIRKAVAPVESSPRTKERQNGLVSAGEFTVPLGVATGDDAKAERGGGKIVGRPRRGATNRRSGFPS